jgi:hypothetical protein
LNQGSAKGDTGQKGRNAKSRDEDSRNPAVMLNQGSVKGDTGQKGRNAKIK